MHHLWFTWCVWESIMPGLCTNGIHAGISDAYYCAECTRLEKDRDGCPKIVNLGASRTDLFYERRRLGECGPFLYSHCVLTELNRFQEGLVNLCHAYEPYGAFGRPSLVYYSRLYSFSKLACKFPRARLRKIIPFRLLSNPRFVECWAPG